MRPRLISRHPSVGEHREEIADNVVGECLAVVSEFRTGAVNAGSLDHFANALETGAVLAVTLQPATAGDTNTLHETLTQCGEHIREVAADTNNKAEQLNPEGPAKLVLDKGYHSMMCWSF